MRARPFGIVCHTGTVGKLPHWQCWSRVNSRESHAGFYKYFIAADAKIAFQRFEPRGRVPDAN